MHFLTRCSDFCKPLKKNSEYCASNQVPVAAMTSASDEKLWTFNCFFFQSREQVVVRRGQIWRVGWIMKTMETQAGHFLLSCKCPVSRDIVQEQDPLGELLAVFFHQNVLHLHQQRWVILRVDSLTLWKIINEEDAVLIPKIEARNFPADFCTRNFLERGEPLCRHSIDCYFSPGHSDITRFRPWSPIATGNHLDRAKKKSKSCSDDWHRWRFWSAFGHFGTHFVESFRMSKSSWMMDPTPSREIPCCSAIDLAEILRSSKISSWIWSIIVRVFTVLGCPGRGASQVEKSPRLNRVTQYLTVAYDGSCSPNIYFRMEWISFGALPCTKKKAWWQLASACCWNRARRLTGFLSASVTRKDLQFGTWTDPPPSNDTIDSVLRHREVGRAKDLPAPPRRAFGIIRGFT